MQAIVVSDTHGRNEILELLFNKYPNADAFIHCGDLEDDPRFYPQWLIVRGNNDFYGDFKNDLRIKLGNHRIYVSHSHRCSYLYRDKNLARLAKEYDCDIVCYGHTHVSKISQCENVFLLNPGSTWNSRDGKSPSYAILNIEDNRIEAQIVHMEDWQF